MGKKTTVSCGKQLDIAHVENLKERFQAALNKSPAFIQVKAEQVERTDSAGLQLLVATQLYCQNAGIAFGIHKATSNFLDSAKLLGLSEVLNLES